MRVEGSSGLAAEIDGATIRIGWREPDWLGPGAPLPSVGTEWSITAADDALVLTLSHPAGRGSIATAIIPPVDGRPEPP